METGWCVWVTGLPASGKSVISRKLLELLNEKHLHAQLLSSDALRKILTPNPTYSPQERDVVYDALAYIAALLTQNGVNVIVDATANLRRYRDKLRQQLPRFVEVYLECPMDVCIKREAARKQTYHAPKGIYSKALTGKTQTVPGMGQPYEPPLNPEVTIQTTKDSVAQAAKKIYDTVLALPP
ncbi:MAG: adenylyl-sulfate kinase [Candidatus Bathyarchaeota archaeon]|nr:adenylyl-sulfate kinase [Candidatus Bathyarchaeota archaeon]